MGESALSSKSSSQFSSCGAERFVGVDGPVSAQVWRRLRRPAPERFFLSSSTAT